MWSWPCGAGPVEQAGPEEQALWSRPSGTGPVEQALWSMPSGSGLCYKALWSRTCGASPVEKAIENRAEVSSLREELLDCRYSGGANYKALRQSLPQTSDGQSFHSAAAKISHEHRLSKNLQDDQATDDSILSLRLLTLLQQEDEKESALWLSSLQAAQKVAEETGLGSDHTRSPISAESSEQGIDIKSFFNEGISREAFQNKQQIGLGNVDKFNTNNDDVRLVDKFSTNNDDVRTSLPDTNEYYNDNLRTSDVNIELDGRRWHSKGEAKIDLETVKGAVEEIPSQSDAGMVAQFKFKELSNTSLPTLLTSSLPSSHTLLPSNQGLSKSWIDTSPNSRTESPNRGPLHQSPFLRSSLSSLLPWTTKNISLNYSSSLSNPSLIQTTLTGVKIPKRRSPRDLQSSPQRAFFKRSVNHQFLTVHPSQSSTTTIKVPEEHFPNFVGANDLEIRNKLADFDRKSPPQQGRPNVSPKRSSSSRSQHFYRSLLKRRMNDEASNSSAPLPPSTLSEEYVKLLERQVRDLRSRVKSCRSCLTRGQRRTPSCGGGAGWRHHRRQEKIIRRQLKLQRKAERENSSVGQSDGDEDLDRAGELEMLATEEEHQTAAGYLASSAEQPAAAARPSITPHQARENRRQSTDFRRGFNQKIVRMDEALQQFSETQSAFCKELRDNLGARLEKRGLELGALSEQVAALVRSSTKQVARLEMLTSDQMYTGQQSIEKSLANLLTLKDAQVRFIKGFHKTTLLPAMIALNTLLSDHASAVTSLGADIITKVEHLQDTYVTHATRQADSLQKLTQEVEMFAPKHTNLAMRGQDLAKRLHANAEAFVREIQTRMNNVVKELVVIRVQSQSFVSFSDATYTNISSSLNQTEEAVEELSGRLQERVSAARVRQDAFKEEFSKETDLITSRMEGGVSGALTTNHLALGQVEEAELETRRFVNAASASWSEHYMTQEHEMRLQADRLANDLQSYTHHTQNILAGLNNAAETHEQVLEEQRADFSRFVRKRQEALDTQCHAISDWSGLMSAELRRRDHDLHRFLSDSLHYSLAHIPYPEEVDRYLVSRLPDGTLLYHSPPRTGYAPHQSAPEEGLPPDPVPPEEPTLTNTGGPSHLPSNTSRPQSSPSPGGDRQSPARGVSREYLNATLRANVDQSSNQSTASRTSERPTTTTTTQPTTTQGGGDASPKVAPESSSVQSSGKTTSLDMAISPAHSEIDGTVEHQALASLEEETTETNFNKFEFEFDLDRDESSSRGPAVNGRGGIVYKEPDDIDFLEEDQVEGNARGPNLNETAKTSVEFTSGADNNVTDNETGNHSIANPLPQTGNQSFVNSTAYTIHGFTGDGHPEEDEGFLKLQSILHAAERSILDFQNDIQVSSEYPRLQETDFSSTSWLRPNGRFESGFWDDFPTPANNSRFGRGRPTYTGKPGKTVWTPKIEDELIQDKLSKSLRSEYARKKSTPRRNDKSESTEIRDGSNHKKRHQNHHLRTKDLEPN